MPTIEEFNARIAEETAKYEALVTRKNEKSDYYNGIYDQYKYPVLTENEYITFKYFRKMQNDNPAFFDKTRKNWLFVLTDDKGENYNRTSTYPTIAEELNQKMTDVMDDFKANRRGINHDYYENL